MFKKARLQLTAWYLLIIMAISMFFSISIYNRVNDEYSHFERVQEAIQEEEELQALLPFNQQRAIHQQFDPQLVQNARWRLIWSLSVINAIIFGLAGVSGYFLAGRTLRPIQLMVDEQKRFIADASHELRTPLTALRSEIEVGLRNKIMHTVQAKKLLSSNLEEVINLQVLSDNLLLLAQGGKVNPRATERVVIADALESAMKKLNGLLTKKNVLITRQVDSVMITGMRDRIVELFVILLDNAVKYSHGKSTITILAKKTKTTAVITFLDTGIGIHEDDLPHIFDRFYRASKSRSKGSAPGYGLGLSIAKKIVTMHKGTITAKSEVGKGTAFTITLPLMQK